MAWRGAGYRAGIARPTPDEYRAALKAAIDRNWLTIHRSGVYVTFTQTGAELFA
jgi:hypothetical protein